LGIVRSRLNIGNCLLRINGSVTHDLNGLEEEFRKQALKELKCAVRNAERNKPGVDREPVVRVSARRLHFYGQIGVFHPGCCQGRYRVRLETVCWLVSDYSVPQNEIFVTIE
jgi:hypothetical protein